ncbi:MAG: T9SS type A sorting domain-containing protein [Saprospiraceae bacterium]
MKKYYLLLSLLFSAPFLSAQSDWQLFRPGVQYLFDYENAGYLESPLLGVKIDAEPCTEMYPALRFRGEFECNEIAASFLGYEVCQTQDEARLRVRDDEYVTIRTNTDAGEVWPAYIQNGDTVWAEVFSIQDMDFLGLTDEVKAIYFYRQENGGAQEFIPAENHPILVSRQYGLISSFWFRDFPNYTSEAPTESILMPLAGLSEPEVGLQNPGWEDIFSFQTGDELHILNINESIYYGSQGENLGFVLEKAFLKATITNVEMTVSPQQISFQYNAQRIKTKRVTPPTGTYEVFPLETFSGVWEYTLAGLEYLDFQPGALLLETQGDDTIQIRTVVLGDASFCDRSTKGLGTPLIRTENCGYQSLIDSGPGNFYRDGLAGPYYYDYGFGGSSTRDVAYFRQDTFECGTPFDFDQITSTDEIPDAPVITLGPNPTAGPLRLQLPQGLVADLKLYDPHGRLLLSENQAQGTVDWNLNALPAGAYQISASQDGKMIWRQRVLKL